MSITHHPDESTLMSFAAGSLPEALRAVVAAHLAVCETCRHEVALLDDIGAALLSDTPKVGLSDRLSSPVFEVTAAARAGATDDVSHPIPDVGGEHGDVPWPLVPLVGANIDEIPWKRLGLGLWHYPIPLSDGTKGDLRFLKVAPNRAMPDHGHGGAELTIVLKGAYCDHTGLYGRGDVADLDDSVEHQPISDAHEGCICLIASERPARFKGFIGRLVQPFAGL
jgi:putative transcriptional regulator